MQVAGARGLPSLTTRRAVCMRAPLSRMLPPGKRIKARCTFRRKAVQGDVEEDPLGHFCPVPFDQQPIQELKHLQVTTGFSLLTRTVLQRGMPQGILFFDWATLPFPEFLKKMGLLWSGFCIISFPVSAATFDPAHEPVPFFVAGSCGSLFMVMIVVFRLFLGWSHVRNRLVSETVEYEESGWYDGQIWTKTQECLNRDRLASSYTVQPALERIKATLLTISGSFVTSLILLSFMQPAHPPPEHLKTQHGMYTRAQTAETDDYWIRVRKFEPWLFEEENDNFP